MAYQHIRTSEMGKLEIPLMAEPDAKKIDGIPVTNPLYELCVELRKKFPKIKFYANANYNSITAKTNVYSDVLVYVDDCDYTLGRVGHGQRYLFSNDTDEPVFMIESRKIQNEKYAPYRDQYHRVFTKNVATALKQSLRYLLPYSPIELLTATQPAVKSKVDAQAYARRKKLDDAGDALANRIVVAQELEALIARGIEFSTPKFQAHAKDVVDAYQKWNAKKNKSMPMYFVSVRMVGDRQLLDIIQYDDVRLSFGSLPDALRSNSIPADDVPEDIKAKIATLMMLDVNQYVEGVGQRASDRTFWIARDV